MDSQSQLVRSQFHDQHGHGYEGDQSAAPTGTYQDEHHHEKKPSVLKKVKAKAKKLKDSLTKHGHTHDHDHDRDQEEDDDEDEELVRDPEVHGAPMFNSAAGQFGTDVGRTAAAPLSTHHIPCTSLPLQEHQILAQPPATLVNKAPPVVPHNTPAAAPALFSTTNYQRTRDSTDTDPTKTFLYGREDIPRVNLDRPRGGLEEDPAAPNRRHVAANYETKVTDPTHKGGEEMEVTPILKSFEKMSVHQEPTEAKSRQRLDQNLPLHPQTQHHHYSNLPYTGTGNHNLFSPETHRNLTTHDHDRNETNQNLPIHHQYDHYSNLPFTGTGTHDQLSPETHHHDEFFNSNPPITGTDSSQNQYSSLETGTGFGFRGHDQSCAEPKHNLPPIDETTNQISESPTGTLESFGSEQFLPISESEYSQPSLEDGADMTGIESGYTEKISTTITEKAKAAKNAVASKLGYGGNDDAAEQEIRDSSAEENVSSTNYKPVTATATEYGKKIAATVTEKLSPVYEKVAGAGSTVISKITPGGTGEQDEHFADKLKPGEEDRALSEVIAEALHKKKVETGKEEEEMEAAELEEVADRVRDGRPTGESGGVVDKVKGAVGSWLGMGDPSHGTERSSDDAGEIGEEMGGGGGELRR